MNLILAPWGWGGGGVLKELFRLVLVFLKIPKSLCCFRKHYSHRKFARPQARALTKTGNIYYMQRSERERHLAEVSPVTVTILYSRCAASWQVNVAHISSCLYTSPSAPGCLRTSAESTPKQHHHFSIILVSKLVSQTMYKHLFKVEKEANRLLFKMLKSKQRIVFQFFVCQVRSNNENK